MPTRSDSIIPFTTKVDYAMGLKLPMKNVGAANYTATIDDCVIYNVNASAASRTVTLPAASSCYPGQIFIVKAGTVGSGNSVTVNTAGGTIDGSASATISSTNGVLRVISDGTNYYTI
jgi:hypothetical protein